jgi:cell division septum initiation protein DivIVA
MISAGTIRFLPRYTYLTCLSSVLVLFMLVPAHAQSAKPQQPNNSNQAKPLDSTTPNVLSPDAQNSSVLSIQGGQRLMSEASSAVSAQDYPLATKKLQDARQVFNQVSNFYQELATSFSGIDNRLADTQRKKALETAQMRDDATYQLALVHRAQNQPELAVPLLVQIIRSQNPTRDLGKKAYQQLFELGFVDAPFPTSGGASNQNTSGGATPQGNSPANPPKK